MSDNRTVGLIVLGLWVAYAAYVAAVMWWGKDNE